jgi:cytochrome c oxidase assembly protein subunit 15
MTAQPLYDLSPALQVALAGIAIALLPLGWVWVRNARTPTKRLRALTVLTLFLTFDLVLFGAFTRLTDSGLGCPDWPGCYGEASPSGAHAQISEAQAAMPTGPVTHSKAWVEMVHRYLATGVGVLILTLAAATWWRRWRAARLGYSHRAEINPWWPTATLAWVCLQGAFGALTVTMKLFPAIVTMHLLGGLVLLALLCRQAVAYEHAGNLGRIAIGTGLRKWLVAATALLWLQVALGGWVSTNYAVLACTQFPTCQGSWWPAMDFAQGFELWRHLGVTGAGDTLAFPALTAIHYVHRLSAYAVFLVLGAFAWQLRHAMPRQAKWMGGLLAWQFATGLSNVVLGWPLVAAVAHTGGAAALVVVLTWTWCESRAGAADPALHTRVPAPEAAR